MGCMQVRVVQGKEPAQFVGIWNGSMVVYEGGVASGFKSFKEEDTDGSSDGATKLFQVRYQPESMKKVTSPLATVYRLPCNFISIYLLLYATTSTVC